MKDRKYTLTLQITVSSENYNLYRTYYFNYYHGIWFGLLRIAECSNKGSFILSYTNSYLYLKSYSLLY